MSINNIMQQQLAQADVVLDPCQSAVPQRRRKGRNGFSSASSQSVLAAQCPVKSIPLRLLVPRRPMRRAVPDGEQVVVTRNVTVPRQVIWILEVTGTPTAGVLDYADSGLWGSKENWVVVTSSGPKTPDSCGSLPAQDIYHCGS